RAGRTPNRLGTTSDVVGRQHASSTSHGERPGPPRESEQSTRQAGGGGKCCRPRTIRRQAPREPRPPSRLSTRSVHASDDRRARRIIPPAMPLTHLDCTKCDRRYQPGAVLYLCTCGAPLFARYDLERAARDLRPGHLALREPSLWRYRDVLPVDDP